MGTFPALKVFSVTSAARKQVEDGLYAADEKIAAQSEELTIRWRIWRRSTWHWFKVRRISSRSIERIHPDYHKAARGRAHLITVERKAGELRDMVYLRMDGTPIDVESSACAPPGSMARLLALSFFGK